MLRYSQFLYSKSIYEILGDSCLVENNIYKKESFTAEENKRYFVDTRDNAINITVPAVSRIGSEIQILDIGNSFDINNCIIVYNDVLLDGKTENLILDEKGLYIYLIYSNLPNTNLQNGWIIIN